MVKTITIHHFEDEPETMHWLPGALLNRYIVEKPEWIKEGGSYSEKDDESEVNFQLNPPSGKINIKYKVYNEKKTFKKEKIS